MVAGIPAGQVLSATLVRRRPRRSHRVLGWVTSLVNVVCWIFDDTWSSPFDLVVTSTVTGDEVLRTRCSGSDEAARTLAHVDEQLATLTAEEFCERWGITWTPGPGRPADP